jgi:hypothetical protein
LSALSAPPTSGSFDKDLDNDIRRDAYQSSSGNSSPQREEEEASAPSAAAAGDLNFHVDDIEMWEVLEALDGAPLAIPTRGLAVGEGLLLLPVLTCAAPFAWQCPVHRPLR